MKEATVEPVRFSNLKRMAQSPAHYLCAVARSNAAMERGSAVHSLVLGGPRVICFSGKVRRGAEWEKFRASNPDAIILTETEHAKAIDMAAAVMSNPVAMSALEGIREKEVNWSFLGRACQSHIDVIGGSYVTELKTCAVGQPDRFGYNALKYGYHAQLAFYMEAVREAGLGNPSEAYIVAVESYAPYVVTTLKLTERALEHGARLYRLWFERLLACEAAGEFPGYCNSIVPLDAPEDDVELTFGASGEVAETSEGVPF